MLMAFLAGTSLSRSSSLSVPLQLSSQTNVLMIVALVIILYAIILLDEQDVNTT
jgi:hypothetical protein